MANPPIPPSNDNGGGQQQASSAIDMPPTTAAAAAASATTTTSRQSTTAPPPGPSLVAPPLEEPDHIGPNDFLRIMSPPPLKSAHWAPSTLGADGPMVLSVVPVSFDYTFIPSLKQSWGKFARRLKARVHVPYLPWWGNRKGYLSEGLVWHDALTGLMCAVLVIPESLSYMLLASLAPVVGLYTAAVAPFAYALLGTSPHVSVGPTSLVSLFLPSVFDDLGLHHEIKTASALGERQEAASVLALYVFLIFFVVSFLRLGGVVKFLSHDLMTGFITASGLFVGIKELNHLLSLETPTTKTKYNYQRIALVFQNLGEADMTSLALGGTSLLIFLTTKILKRRYPATPERLQSRLFKVWYYCASFTTLIVIVVATGISYLLTKQGFKVHILGDLPTGLGTPHAPSLEKFNAGDMIREALPVAVLAYVEAYSISKKYSVMYHSPLDCNQDLASFAFSNLLCSVFGGVIPSGSFSRTALSAEMGAKTPWANFFTGAFVIICLYSTQILYYIPYCVLGALLESAMFNLISFREFYHALRIARTSGLVMIFTFFVTLLMSIQDGLLYGVAASLALLLYQLSDVDCVVMGKEPRPLNMSGDDGGEHTLHLLSLRDNPRAIPVDESAGIIVIKPVASLFFGNAELLLETIEQILARVVEERKCNGTEQAQASSAFAAAPPPLPGPLKKLPSLVSSVRSTSELTDNLGTGVAKTRFLLIDAGGIRLFDLWALSCFVRAVEDAATKGIQVFISNSSRKLKASLKACGLWERVGGPLIMHSTEEVFYILSQAPALLPKLSAETSSFRLPTHIAGIADEEDEEDEEGSLDAEP